MLPASPGTRPDPWDALFETGGLESLRPGPRTTGAAFGGEGATGGDLEGEPPPGGVAASLPTTTPEVMQLTADYVEYDRKTGRVVLKGKAYSVLGDMQLWAEGMEVELGAGAVYATGTVRFMRPGDDIKGRSLTYNYKLREGEMHQADTWRGPNRFHADRMEITPFKLVGHEAFTTACDHDPPHYRVTAKRATLIPGDKLVLERAGLYKGRKRLLGFRRYKVNLKAGQGGGSNFYLKPGYSSSRGFTLESGYDFYFSDTEFGRVVFNPTSKAGGTGGLAFRYGYEQDSSGDLRLFRSVVRIQGGAATSAFLDQKADSYTWSHREKLSGRGLLTSNLNVSRQDVGTLGVNEELIWNGSLVQHVPEYTLQLQLNRRVDTDGDRYLFDNNVPVLNMTPRLTVSRDEAFDLGGDFRMGFRMGLGRIEERLSGQAVGQEATQTDLHLNFTGPGVTLGRTTLAWNLEERLDWYTGNQDRQYTSLSVNGTTRLDDEFELAYNYVLQRVGGKSPFASYDLLADANVGSLFLRQRRGRRFNATWIQLSEDLDRGRFRSAASSLFWHAREGTRTPWAFGLNLGYAFTGDQKLDDIELRTASTNLRFGRDDWRHQLITNFDTRKDRLESFSLGSDFRIDDRWRVQLSTNYGRGGDGSLDRTRLAVGITRDLHAWEARLRWDVEQQEAFLEFYLKHNSQKKIALRADFDEGLGIRPQFGDSASRPGPILADIPRP